MKKRILITGAAGFLGNALFEFVKEDHKHLDAYGIDTSFKNSDTRRLRGDLNDSEFLYRTIKKIRPHYIFHLAGVTKTIDLKKLISSNLFLTKKLLDSVLRAGNLKARIIVPGSAAEYGCVSKKDMPVKEDCAPAPINPYGISKALQTFLSLTYHRKGLDIMVGRIFNVIGRGTPASLSVGRFAHDLSLIKQKQGSRSIETGDLDTKRDFVDIDDACSAMIAIARRGKPGSIYNICSGKSHKLSYALDYLCKLSGIKGIKIKRRAAIDPGVNDIVGSNKKTKRHTGWAPRVSMSESLKDTLNYWDKGFRGE